MIDVGINRTDDGLRGDVDFDAAVERAGLITPGPGRGRPDDDRDAVAQHPRGVLPPAAVAVAGESRAEDRTAPYIGLTRGELISAAGALALLVAMFAVAWYGVDAIPGAAATSSPAATSENAWDGLTVIRWLMLLTVLVALGAVAVHAWHPTRVTVARLRLALLALSTANAAALIFRVLIVLPSSDRVPDQKLGGVVGVIAALGIAVGAYEAVREQRARLLGLVQASDARDPLPSAPSGALVWLPWRTFAAKTGFSAASRWSWPLICWCSRGSASRAPA